MQRTLLLLSELASTHFDPHNGMLAALSLKQMGARRADISTDPRISCPQAHGAYARPVTDFDKAARELARTILAPVIGQSAVVDFTHATRPAQKTPDLSSLSTVGLLFAKNTDGTMPLDMATSNGRALGFILYLSLNTAYDALVLPNLTGINRQILRNLGSAAIGNTIEGYGDTVNLAHLRERLRTLQSANTSAPSQKYLM